MRLKVLINDCCKSKGPCHHPRDPYSYRAGDIVHLIGFNHYGDGIDSFVTTNENGYTNGWNCSFFEPFQNIDKEILNLIIIGNNIYSSYQEG